MRQNVNDQIFIKIATAPYNHIVKLQWLYEIKYKICPIASIQNVFIHGRKVLMDQT